MFDITKHKIYLDFIDELNPIAIKFYNANKKRKDPILTKREEFVFDIFHKLNEIEKKLKDLNYSVMFFSVYPNYKPWRDNITREDYIIYHLEYYYINIIALFDRLLHFVNFIYNLGLSDHFVTLKCITTNDHVDKNTVRILKKIDTALQGIRSTQNKIKHKKKHRDKKLYHASLIEFHGRHNTFSEYTKELNQELQSDMNYFYREYLRTKKQELIKNNKVLGDTIKILLDNIFPIYEKRKLEVSK